jgi:hypothetical protein
VAMLSVEVAAYDIVDVRPVFGKARA